MVAAREGKIDLRVVSEITANFEFFIQKRGNIWIEIIEQTIALIVPLIILDAISRGVRLAATFREIHIGKFGIIDEHIEIMLLPLILRPGVHFEFTFTHSGIIRILLMLFGI